MGKNPLSFIKPEPSNKEKASSSNNPLSYLTGDNIQYGIGYGSTNTTFDSKYNTGLVDGVDPNSVRRGNQKWSDLLLNSVINTGAEIGLGALEGTGYLLDLEQWGNLIQNSETEFTNWFSEHMKQAKEYIGEEVAPIYTDSRDEGFQPLNGRWWAKNAPSIGSSLSLLIPAAGGVKALSTTAKALTGTKLVSKINPKVLEGLQGMTGAVFSRYMEGTMEASSTFDTVYQTALSSGKTEEEAKEIAGDAAASTFNNGLALIATDIYQFRTLFKSFDLANSARVLTKSQITKSLGGQALSEAGEEVFQYIVAKEAEREAYVNNEIIEDGRSFSQRMVDYAKDPELWTSAFFGGLGGAVFGGVAEYKANKFARKKNEFANLIKPSVEFDKAVDQNNKPKAKELQDEDFIKFVNLQAKNNTLFKVEEYLTDWKDNLLKLSDEELIDQGTTRENVESVYAERIAQVSKASELFNSINEENLSDDLKSVKFVTSLSREIIKERKNQKKQQIEKALAEIAIENELSPELTELKRLQVLKEAYLDSKSVERAESLTDQILTLAEQIKQLYPDVNIAEKLSSSKNDNFRLLNDQYVALDNNDSYLQQELSKFNSTEGKEQISKEVEEIRKASDEEKFKNLVEQITPNTLISDLNNYEKFANSIGKLEEFKQYKENYLKTLQGSAGFVDFENLATSLEERYTNNNLLSEIEFRELSDKLRVRVLNEIDIEQRYLTDPKAKQIIEQYYNNINDLVSQNLSKQTPSFVATENIEGSEIIEQTVEDITNSNAQFPFLTVGEEFAFEKTETGWKTVYSLEGENKGNPQPSTKENHVNWEEVNKSEFGNAGTVVHFEYDPNTNYNKTLTDENAVNNREVFLVVYKDGNILNQDPRNRVVIGTLKAYRSNVNWNNANEANNLKGLRDSIQKRITELNPTGLVNLGITTKVKEKLPGRVRNTGVYNSPHEVLKDGQPLIFGIGTTINGVPTLKVPTLPANSVTVNNVTQGATYMIVPAANNQLTAIKLFTKKLQDLPQSFEKAKELVELINASENPKDKADLIQLFKEIVGFPTGHIKFNNQVLFFDNGVWKPLSNPQELGNLIAQVDLDKINRGDYNEQVSKAGLLSTNLNPNNHFHSAKFLLSSEYNQGETTPVTAKVTETPVIVSTVTSSTGALQKLGLPNLGKFIVGDDTRGKVVLDGDEYTKWDKNKELAWWKKNLPNVNIEVLDDLTEIYKKGGFKTWGIFKLSGAYIWENAGQGTAYHEAFHAVFNLYLTDAKRAALFDEAATIYNVPRSLERVLEERLADDFADYVMTNSHNIPDTLYNRIVKFFKGLYQLLKSMFTDNVSVDDLFRRIDTGFYTNKNYVTDNNTYFQNPEDRFKLHIDPRKKEHYVRFINTQFFNALDYIRTNYEGYSELNDLEIINKWGRDNEMNGVLAVYGSVLNQLVDFYNETTDEVIKQELVNEENTGILQHFLSVENNKIIGVHDYIASAIINLNNFGFNIKIQDNRVDQLTDSPSDNIEFEIDEDTNNYEGWELKSISISQKETLSYEVKKMLRQTIDGRIDENGEFVPSIDPIFKKPIFVNFDELYNYLERNLSDIHNEDAMLERLDSLSYYKPSLKSILSELQTNSRLRTQFFSNFYKTHVKYTTVKQSVTPGLEGKSTVWKIFNSNRNDIKKLIFNDWFGNFLSNKRTSLLMQDGSINIERAKQLESQFTAVTNNIKRNREVSIPDAERLEKLLFEVGIDLSASELLSINKETQSYYRGVKTTTSGIQNFISLLSGNYNSLDLIFKTLSNGKNPFEGVAAQYETMKRLVNLKTNFSNDIIQSAFRNVENKNVYSHQNPTYLSRFISDLKDGSYVNLHFQDPYFRKNIWLQDIINDPVLQETVDYTYIDGIHYDNNGNGIKYTKMSPKDFETTTLNMWIGSEKNGNPSTLAYYPLPVLADSPTLAFIRFKKYREEEILEGLYEVALQEYERIQNARADIAAGLPQISNYHKNTKFVFLPFLNDVNLEVLTEKENTKELIKEWLNEEFRKETEFYRTSGMLVGNSLSGTVSDNAIRAYGNDSMNLLKEYFVNKVFSNIQLFQLLHADPSFYKASDLRAGKRNNQVTKPGLRLNTNAIRPHYNTIYVNDVIESEDTSTNAFRKSVRSILKGTDPKKIDEIIKQYDDVNTTDAQSFITLDRYKEIMTGLGRWTDKYEQMYKRLKSGKATKEDLGIVLQPIKPFYFNHHFVDGKIIPVQNKNSEAVLIPELVNKSPKLKRLLDYMTKNDIDSVQFESAVKTGLYGNVDINEMLEGNATPIIHSLSNSHYAIQQEVPEHHLDSQNLFGTQLRKLALADLSTTENYLNDYNAEKIVQLYNELISTNVIEDFQNVSEQFSDLVKLSNLIKEEVRSRGLGENFEELAALEYGEDGNVRFKYPLYFPTQSQRVESLLSSIFKNRITKQKIKGGSFVLVSNYGFAEDLKIVINEKEKVIEYMEVIMPWSSSNFMPLLPNGEIDMSKIDKDLLEGIGYRIPTESAGYSVKKIKIKKFAPKESGGIVILPSEITKIAGEDFDIDKLYVMFPEFKVSGNRAVKVEYNYELSPEENSREARNNALIDIISSIWSSQNMVQNIVEPGGYERLANIKRQIVSENEQSSIALPIVQRDIFNKNMTAGTMIGMFANHNTNHAVVQHFNLNFETEILFDKEKRTNISGTFDTKGNYISRNIALFLAASVDNAKDPILNALNINPYTVDVLMAIVRVGYPIETAIYFINQPIIKEFIEVYNNSTEYNREDKIVKVLRGHYGALIQNEGKEIPIAGAYNLSTSNLLKNLRGEVDNLTQLKVLESFVAYKTEGSKLNTLISVTRPDNIGSSKSIAANSIYLNKVERAYSNNIIPGIKQILNNGSNYSMIYNFMKYGIKEPTKILNNYFPYNNLFYTTGIEFLQYLKKSDLTEQEILHFNNEVFRYKMSNFFNDVNREDLITNLPDKVESYKAQNINKLGLFQFVGNLKIEKPTTDIPYKRITFSNNISLTNEQKNYIMDSFEYMLTSGTQEEKALGKDLIAYSFLTSGYQFSSNTFAHLIPHSYLRQMVNSKGEKFIDYVNAIKDNTLDAHDSSTFVSQYIRNFYRSLNSVPKLLPNSENFSSYKRTKAGNITSIKVEASSIPNSEAIIEWNKVEGFDDSIPVYRKYIAVYNKDRYRLYQFAGFFNNSKDGVYNIIPDLGVEGFAAEYNTESDVNTIFNKNILPPLDESMFFDSQKVILTDVTDRFVISNEEAQDNINKCE